MKTLFLALAFVLVLPAAFAQQRDNLLPRVSPSAMVGQTVGITDVVITYGRPSVRERTLFGAEGSGALETYGDVWRAGADEATTITFGTDVLVEGQPLAAGTYSLFTIPMADSWTLVFNRTANQWGAYQYDDAQDALRVTVTPATGSHIEQFMFWFQDVTATSARAMLGWGPVQVGFTINADTEALVMGTGEAAVMTSDDWQIAYRYANYALARGLPPQTPLMWAERAVSLNEAYNTVALKARLQAATGDLDSAVQTAEAAVALAEAMENRPGNLDALRKSIEEWRAQMQ